MLWRSNEVPYTSALNRTNYIRGHRELDADASAVGPPFPNLAHNWAKNRVIVARSMKSKSQDLRDFRAILRRREGARLHL
jgi:hypothetical protein